MEKIKKNKIAMVGLFVIIIMTIMSIIGPMMVPYVHSDNDLSNTDQWPSKEHWFGTDDLGRDLWARVWVELAYLCL